MTVYTYLGWGTTNENGVAKLDHDANGDPLSHSYTGVGAGELDVLASLDNPVVEGSVVSQPYTVIDGQFLDSSSANWFAQSGGSTSFSNGVRTFESTEIKAFVPHKSSGSNWSVDFTRDAVMECDINTISCTELNLQDYDGTKFFSKNIVSYLSNGCHLLVKFYDDHFDGYIDGATTPTFTQTHSSELGDGCRISFQVKGGSLTCSNIVIYPI